MISAFNFAISLVYLAIEAFNLAINYLNNLILTFSAFDSYNKLSSMDYNKVLNKA